LISEGFCVLTTKKTSLALHIYWTTTPKDGRKHDFWFVKGIVCVSSLMDATPLSFILLHSLSLSLCYVFFSPNDASIYRLQWRLLLHLSTMVAILCQWLVQLLLTIFSCHQQSTIVWQNSAVIFEKSHIPHMKSVLVEIWALIGL